VSATTNTAAAPPMKSVRIGPLLSVSGSEPATGT
jgi:hypothetical protein